MQLIQLCDLLYFKVIDTDDAEMIALYLSAYFDSNGRMQETYLPALEALGTSVAHHEIAAFLLLELLKKKGRDGRDAVAQHLIEEVS